MKVEARSSYAYFRISIESMSLSEMSELLGRHPDRGWSVGERFRRERSTKELVRSFTLWEMRSGAPEGASIQDHLDALLPRVEHVANSLEKREGLACSLQVVQHFASERERDRGYYLSPKWIAFWHRSPR